MGMAIAIVIGWLSLRGTATGFVILTFALSELLVTIFTNWTSLTGGAVGFVLGASPGRLGGLDLGESLTFYYLTVGFLLLIVALGLGLRHTTFGRRLMTIRDNERLARSLGLDITRHKLAIFAIGGAVAAIGGQLTLYQDRFVEPNLFDVFTAINVQLVVIIGGIASPIGPIIGALIVLFLPEVLHLSPTQSQLAYGVMLVLMATLLPQGLTGALDGAGRWLTRWRTARPRAA
jgi:branched-chain amino acid transport system permease protein